MDVSIRDMVASAEDYITTEAGEAAEPNDILNMVDHIHTVLTDVEEED